MEYNDFSWFKNKKAKEETSEILKDININVNNEDSLEEDFRIRDIIGKPEDQESLKKIIKMNQDAIALQDKLDDILYDLDNKIAQTQMDIFDTERFFQNLQRFKDKLKVLESKIKEEQVNSNEIQNNTSELIKYQDLFKNYNILIEQIQRMESDVRYHDISPENLLKLKEEYSSLKAKYEILEKTWFPKNPLNN